MENQQRTASHPLIYYRLIALWVLNEAMFGGIIHGLKIPVSGLIVGSCAVVCICLIAWYVPVRGAIIKATLIVAIFKMMLSPQSPPPAYIAVFFQGMMGELLFINRKFFKLSCVVLAILALAESGLQRILVLTIVYGNDLWDVINNSVNRLAKKTVRVNYSLVIAGGYVLLHLITGVVVGWWAALLPGKIEAWSKQVQNRIIITGDTATHLPDISKKRKWLKKGMFIIWIILVGLYVQSYYKIGTPFLPTAVSLKILVRSFIIVLSWYFLIGPVLRQLLHYWLQKKQSQSQEEIRQVLKLLPTTRLLVANSWKQSAGTRGMKRIIACTKIILVNALNPLEGRKVVILTGAVQTGKTTSLVKWADTRTDVFGILTPVVNGKRMFMNIHACHLFDMEAGDDEKATLTVGRFVFSKAAFDKAVQVLREAKDKNGWIVIDEIGPMELRGEGFREILKEIMTLQNEKQKILLVVREGLVEEVKASFQLNEAVVISQVSNLV